jgi:hypothetical protein
MRLYLKPHELGLLKLQKTGVLADDSCDEDENLGGDEVYDSLVLKANVGSNCTDAVYDGNAFKNLIASLD